MAQVASGPKVLVAAAFQPLNLLLLGGSWGGAILLGLFVWAWLTPLVGVAGTVLYAGKVAALAGDREFARSALAAGDLGRPALAGSDRLVLMEQFGKLPPQLLDRVTRLAELGDDVEGRLQRGAGTVYDGALAALAPQVKAVLDEAVTVAGRGVSSAGESGDMGETLTRLDRITEILESMKGDLITMEGEPEAFEDENVVLQLEDLSSEVRVLKDSLAELGE